MGTMTKGRTISAARIHIGEIAPDASAPRASLAMERYLRVAHALCFAPGRAVAVPGPPFLLSHLVDVMHVSRAAVGDMVARLEANGHLLRSDKRRWQLTLAGYERAEVAVRCQRIVARFLVDALGYDALEAMARSGAISAAASLDTIDRMHDATGRAERDPLGWPIEPVAEHEENPGLVSAGNLRPGERAVAVRLARHPRRLVARMTAAGLHPPLRFEVVDDALVTGVIRIDSDAGEATLSPAAAGALWVRRLDAGR